VTRAHNLHCSADRVGFGRLAGDNARAERVQQRSQPSTSGKRQHERVGT